MRKVYTLILIFLLIPVLTFCASGSGIDKSIGILADEAAVSSIRQELDDMENALLAANGDVFWTKSGSIWHTSHKCSYLSRSKVIYHGSVEEAMLEGKLRGCTRCAQSDADDIWEQIYGREPQAGDVFFVREGILFHLREDCPAMGAGEVYCGNRATALLLGKSRECEECKNYR